jgi:hypothetical protein
MPNWCCNSIVFSGDKENLEKLKTDLSQPVFAVGVDTGWLLNVSKVTPPWGMYWTDKERLEKSVLEPYQRVCSRTLTGLDLDHNSIGYDEMISTAVGCKWDFDLEVWEETEDYLSYGFQSPWSPPLIWVARIALKYKLQVKIEFEEGGSDFAGKLKANGVDGTGILIESTYAEYRLADLGSIDEWVEVDIGEWCEDEAGIQEWRERAKDWPTTMAEYDVKYLSGEFDLKDHFIPSSS